MLGDAVFVGVGDVERPREVLAQLMAGRQLQRLAVAHHALTGQGGGGAGRTAIHTDDNEATIAPDGRCVTPYH
jgi:hypothetical protein